MKENKIGEGYMEKKELGLIQQNRERSRKIRAVVSDMDGSFLDESGGVSKRNLQAVRKLQEAGIPFVVCTGRSFEEAQEPLKEVGLNCDMIAMNGAAIYRKDGQVLREYVLSQHKIHEILKTLEMWKERLIIQLVTDKGDYIIAREELFRDFFHSRIFPKKERSQEEEDILFEAYHRTTPEEFEQWNHKCYKIVTLSQDTGLIDEIRQPLEAVGNVCVAASFPTNWEITHERASKGEGLKDYAEIMGFGLQEVMAFGDGDNDRTMLALPLGWSVAMGNAGEYLKEVVHIITGSHKEDGFSQAIELLLDVR